MKRLLLIPVLVPAFVLLPVLLVLYLNLGGAYRLIKARTRELVCSVDTDCPEGHVCVNGKCIPAT